VYAELENALLSPSRRRLFAGIAAVAAAARGTPAMAATTAGTPPAAVRWLTRATFGYSSAELAAFNALGSSDDARWTAWVSQQLNPTSIGDSACDSRVAGAQFITLGKTAAQLWADHHSDTDSYYNRILPVSETECMTLIRQVYSKRQLFEVMVDFWHDHFSVFGWDYDGGPMFPAFDRDAIRANALGNFRTMLEASGRSASMMYMLDLYASTRAGPNENYARELCELHTLGAENYAGILRPDDASLPIGTERTAAGGARSIRLKYVDDDVYEATRILTGLTISGSTWPYDPIGSVPLGEFAYDDSVHDQYPKSFLNSYFSSYQHQADATQLYDILAAHPGTAHFLAGKLCRRLVGDTASASLVESAASLFQSAWQASNQIAQVIGLILKSDEFKSTWGAKIKRPAVAAVSALRATSADFTPVPDNSDDWTTTEEFVSRLQSAGHRLFYWPAPNGYPDDQTSWSSTGAMGMTLRLLPRLLEMHKTNGDNNTPFIADVQAQTLAAFPNAQDRTAANLVGYWCDRILGYRPEPTYTQAVDFLRQEAAANAPLDIVSDAVDKNTGLPQHTGVWNMGQLSQHYTIARLRTAIALILCSPDFLRR
jgi:uncharacterized protein (DUF1800 family)